MPSFSRFSSFLKSWGGCFGAPVILMLGLLLSEKYLRVGVAGGVKGN